MLPKGWVETTLGDIIEFKYGNALPKQSRVTGDFPVFGSNGIVGYHQEYLVKGPSIIIGRKGSSGSVHASLTPCYPIDTTYYVNVFDSISFYFAGYLLKTLKLDTLNRSTAIPGLNRQDAYQLPIKLPPLAEQRRIVAKLDSLTARIARARAELERVQVLKVHLRQQALRSCFADLEKHELPLGELLRGIEAGKNMRCVERPPVSGEKGVVKVSAVTWGHFDTTQTKTLPNDYLPPTKARIMKGDLLISRANTLELVGAAVIVDVQPDNIFLSDKILRLLVEEDKKTWVLWYLRSPEGRSQIESLATGNQLSMRNISQAALRQINIPLPTASIRQQRLARLTATIKAEVSLETEAQRALTLLDRLESSLLAKAFRGELVPQDPNDEPASVLLDRIRAERAADTKPKRGRKQSTQDMSLPRKRQTEKHG